MTMTAPRNQKEASARAFAMAHSDDARDDTAGAGNGSVVYQLLDVRAVARLLGVHRATVWRKAAAGQLPPPIRICGLTRWSLAEIEAVITAKLAERDQGEAA